MKHRAKPYQTSLTRPLLLGVIGLALTACGSRLSHKATNSGACDWQAYPQHCAVYSQQAAYYGAQQTQFIQPNYQQQLQQQQFYQQHFVPQFSTPQSAISYVQSPHSVVTYEERTVPLPASAPAPLPSPVSVEIFDTAPIMIEPAPPPISQWAPTETFEPYPWQPEKVCPEGTIRSYNGDSCMQIAIPRK